MKRIYIIYWVLLGILQAGCREDIELYSGTAGIYFAMSIKYGGWNDSELDYTSTSEIPFAVDEREDTVLQVRAKIIGSIADYDRIVSIRIISQEDAETEAKEGFDFDPILDTYYVKANEAYANIPIHFYRRSDLKDKERVLVLELLPSKDFSTPMIEWLRPGSSDKTGVDVLHHTITISDKWIKLPGFNEYYFGTYSEKKNRLMCELFDMKLKDFEKTMTTVKCRTLAIKLDQYLKEQDAQGTPVYEDYRDEEGNPVKMTVGDGINY
ncbi:MULTISPECIES: DUF4843 domain-containing protein [Bacteroides]|uniref:DUF4843 domain-containing protein n=1 Tax=Bacteroides TaxID=816 RepID=UPI0025851E56|nr:DUF4843 domain-containing protein [Bacteroides sp.]